MSATRIFVTIFGIIFLLGTALCTLPDDFIVLQEQVSSYIDPMLVQRTPLGQSLAAERKNIALFTVPALRNCLLADHQELKEMLEVMHAYITSHAKTLPQPLTEAWQGLLQHSVFTVLPRRKKDKESLVKAIEEVIIATADVAEAVNRALHACLGLLRVLSEYIGLDETRVTQLFCTQGMARHADVAIAPSRKFWKNAALTVICIAVITVSFVVCRKLFHTWRAARQRQAQVPSYSASVSPRHPSASRSFTVQQYASRRRSQLPPHAAPCSYDPPEHTEPILSTELRQQPIPEKYQQYFEVVDGVMRVRDADGLRTMLGHQALERVLDEPVIMGSWMTEYLRAHGRASFSTSGLCDAALVETIRDFFVGTSMLRPGSDMTLLQEALHEQVRQVDTVPEPTEQLHLTESSQAHTDQLVQHFPLKPQGMPDFIAYFQSSAFHDAIRAAGMVPPNAAHAPDVARICASQFVDTVARSAGSPHRNAARELIRKNIRRFSRRTRRTLQDSYRALTP